MMMIVALKSLVRQEKGAQREEEAGGRRWVGSIGTPTPSADAPISPTQSRVSYARNKKEHGLDWLRDRSQFTLKNHPADSQVGSVDGSSRAASKWCGFDSRRPTTVWYTP